MIIELIFQKTTIDYDPWHEIRPLMDSLNNAFIKYYKPQQIISIDESMVGMKNRVAYIQYMPQKIHARFGIKKFQLCESRTGYVKRNIMQARSVGFPENRLKLCSD